MPLEEINSKVKKQIKIFDVFAIVTPWTGTNVIILSNVEINEQEGLLTTIQCHNLRFLGHVIHRESESQKKLLLQRKVPGLRGKGRPIDRYIDKIP